MMTDSPRRRRAIGSTIKIEGMVLLKPRFTTELQRNNVPSPGAWEFTLQPANSTARLVVTSNEMDDVALEVSIRTLLKIPETAELMPYTVIQRLNSRSSEEFVEVSITPNPDQSSQLRRLHEKLSCIYKASSFDTQDGDGPNAPSPQTTTLTPQPSTQRGPLFPSPRSSPRHPVNLARSQSHRSPRTSPLFPSPFLSANSATTSPQPPTAEFTRLTTATTPTGRSPYDQRGLRRAPLTRTNREVTAVQEASTEDTASDENAPTLRRQPISSVHTQPNEKRRRDMGCVPQCVICTEADVQSCLLPCGHATFCEQCSDRVMKYAPRLCPICRKFVDKAVRIYLSGTTV